MTFKRLSEYFEELEKTTSRLKITEILANLLKEAEKDEIAKICYLSLGRLLPQYEGLEFQMAEKMMIKAIAKTFGIDLQTVQKQYKEKGDLGTVAEEFKIKGYQGAQVQNLFTKEKGSLDIAEVYEKLMEIAKEEGMGSVGRKINKMATLLGEIEALAVRYVVRIPLKKLRLGFSELTLLDALSWMKTGGKSLRSELEGAFNVMADIGKIAEIFKESGESGIKKVEVELGTPILSALAQRLGTVEEMIEKMGQVAVEPKYDGTRLQVHYGDKIEGKVKIFTRNLENVTHMFPEIVEAVKREIKAKEVILDSEGVGVNPKTGEYLPFQETIKRKRKYDIEETAREIPLKCYVFDILYKDKKSLIFEPLRKRREILENTLEHKANTLVLSPQIITSDPKKIREFHEEQIEKGLEGAMVKKADSAYEPGRRGFTWVKYKQEETKKGGGLADTLDCVIMGTYRGRGKRAGFGVGAFLVGVKKHDVFVTVSKIGTGLTDEQWREVYKRTQRDEIKVKDKPEEYFVDKNLYPDSWVKPEIVMEIQADNITESPIHTAGLALRFPRLVRFRDDKSSNQSTSLKELKKLYEIQK